MGDFFCTFAQRKKHGMTTAKTIEAALFDLSEGEAKRQILSSFFKTGRGEYGEGDRFIGVSVPRQRTLAKQIGSLPLTEIDALLQSPYHECRMTALLLLVDMFAKSNCATERQTIYDFYIEYHQRINNWDLVDLSAPQIVGNYLIDKPRQPLQRYAQSDCLWLQRIAIVATFAFIKRHEYADTLAIAQQLLHHRHDLIQKAVGWMLREVGKRDFDIEIRFLTVGGRYKTMPRTMLRYAIEKFPEPLRLRFLRSEV